MTHDWVLGVDLVACLGGPVHPSRSDLASGTKPPVSDREALQVRASAHSRCFRLIEYYFDAFYLAIYTLGRLPVPYARTLAPHGNASTAMRKEMMRTGLSPKLFILLTSDKSTSTCTVVEARMNQQKSWFRYARLSSFPRFGTRQTVRDLYPVLCLLAPVPVVLSVRRADTTGAYTYFIANIHIYHLHFRTSLGMLRMVPVTTTILGGSDMWRR